MSFGDIMFSLMHFFLWHPFPFRRERKVFNGAIACNLSFSYSAQREQNPPKNVNVKTGHAPSSARKKRKKQGEARKSSLRGCRARRSNKKPFLRERSVSFLLKSRSKGNAELTAKSQR
jgi:hypothetical protein